MPEPDKFQWSDEKQDKPVEASTNNTPSRFAWSDENPETRATLPIPDPNNPAGSIPNPAASNNPNNPINVRAKSQNDLVYGPNPGVSEGAGLREGLGEWVDQSGGNVVRGVGDLAKGDIAKGTHKIISGGFNTLAPTVPFAAAAAPVAVGTTMLKGAIGGKVARFGAEHLGATPDQADVAEDVGNIFGGGIQTPGDAGRLLKGKTNIPERIKTEATEGLVSDSDVNARNFLEENYNKAKEEFDKANQNLQAYSKSQEIGIEPPEEYKDAFEKAQSKLAEAEMHRDTFLQSQKAKGISPQVQPTADQIANNMGKPGPDTATEEWVKGKEGSWQKVLKRSAETSIPAEPINVKKPGQIAPEKIDPNALLGKPEVPSPGQTVPLAGNAGVRQGQPLGLPEARPHNLRMPGEIEPHVVDPNAITPEKPLLDRPVVPSQGQPLDLANEGGSRVAKPLALPGGTSEKPLGEILPPEKPAKPGRLGSLKVKEGKIIDTEDPLQQQIEEGLKNTNPKPIALKPLGKQETSLGQIETATKDNNSTTEKTSKPTVEEKTKEKTKVEETEEETKYSPEDVSKAEKTIYELPNQDLWNLGREFGLSTDTKNYDFTKREGPSRHTVDRDRFHKDVLNKIPKDLINIIIRTTNEYEAEGPKSPAHRIEADKSSKFRAQKSRQILNKSLEIWKNKQ